jgi:hypothetical protein
MSRNHIAVLLAIGATVPMQSLAPRPGLAETLGNGEADGFAAIGISDSDALGARATAIGGIAIGSESFALTKDATHPCTGGSDATDCGHGNIAIGISSQSTNDFAVAVGFVSKAGGINSSAYWSKQRSEWPTQLGCWRQRKCGWEQQLRRRQQCDRQRTPLDRSVGQINRKPIRPQMRPQP